MNVYQWLCVVGIPSIITLLLQRIITKRLDAAERRADEARKQAEEQRKKSDAIALGVQALLRDRLLQGYKYYMEKGWVDFDDRLNLENVWEQYHALGANGMMNDMRRAFRVLPAYKGGPPTPIDD